MEQLAPTRDENQILVERVLQTLTPAERAGVTIGFLDAGRTTSQATVAIARRGSPTRYRRFAKSVDGWADMGPVAEGPNDLTYSPPIARIYGPNNSLYFYHNGPLAPGRFIINSPIDIPLAWHFGEWYGFNGNTVTGSDSAWTVAMGAWYYWTGHAPCPSGTMFLSNSPTPDFRRTENGNTCGSTLAAVDYYISLLAACPPPATFSFSGTTDLNEAPYSFSVGSPSAVCGGMSYSWFMNTYGAIHGGGYICTNLATCAFPTNSGMPFLLTVTATKTFANGSTNSASYSWSVTVPLAANLYGPDVVDALALMNWNAGGSGGVGGYSYTWYYDGAQQTEHGTSFQRMLPAGTHSIMVRVTDNRGVSVDEELTVEAIDPNGGGGEGGGGGGCAPYCELRASKTPETKVKKPAVRAGVEVTKPQPAQTKRTAPKP